MRPKYQLLINPEHFEVIPYQKERLGTKKGFIAVKPNCSIQSYAPALTAWMEYEPYEILVTTLTFITINFFTDSGIGVVIFQRSFTASSYVFKVMLLL